MCIFEMFIVKQLQQFEKRLILIKIIYKNKGPALRAPYRDQSVSLSVCLSVCPRYLVRNIPSLPLAQGGSDFTHSMPTVKGCAVILNKVCKGSDYAKMKFQSISLQTLHLTLFGLYFT